MTIWCFKVVKNIATHVVLLLETRSWSHVLYRRQVKRMTETLREEKKKNTGQARSAVISFTAFLYNILWCSFQKKKNHASAFQSLRSASFSMPAIRTHETSHMGGDVFVIHTLKSKAVVSYFFSSVTQARIITVQLLACVAAAGRMASVGRSAR